MRRMITLRNFALTFGVLMICRCGLSSLAGGTSTSENGRVAGIVVSTSGVPARGALVSLFPADYDPQKNSAAIPADTTDSSGRYAFSAISPGSYDAYSVNPSDRTSGLVKFIHVEEDTVIASVDTLQKPGAITVTLPSGLDTNAGYFYVPGTPFHAWISPNKGSITLDSVSANVALSVYYSVKGSGEPPQLVRDSIVVAPGGITNIVNVAWRFSKKLYLNTTPAGADVTSAILNFPILVRLTQRNFTFSEARKDGADIRFAKADGAGLAFEIERWDSVAQAAEIWVKIDTVYGNDSTHSITMYWGNPNAAGASNGAAVFDAQGNAGVWHLGPGLSDATINGDNGVDSSTADAAGVIGRCRHFDPAQHSFIEIPNESRFDLAANFTLSAWVFVDSFESLWQTVVAKGDSAFRLHCDTVSKAGVFSLTDADTVNFGYQDDHGKTIINDHRWHLITGSYDGSVMKMYTDGILENEKTVSMPCLTDNSKLTIGDNRPRSPRFFAGSIDEVRVMRAVMSDDWVKLCYMNQKTSDMLVVFK